MPSSSPPRAALARAIPPRRRARFALGLVLAAVFAVVLLPIATAERWLSSAPEVGAPAPLTVRVPLLAGFDTAARHVGGGLVITRGEIVTPAKQAEIDDLADAMPRGGRLVCAVLLLIGALAAIFTHHMRRSSHGRLLRVQLASLGTLAVTAAAVKALLLATPVSILAVPVALFALVPTLCLDRIVGLATGVLAALVLAILAPFDLGVAILLLVQVAVAGLVVTERPKRRWPAALAAGGAATLCTAVTFPLLHYLTTGQLPALDASAWQAPWLAAALGPAIATALAVPLVPLYQRLVGEITHGRLVALEELSNPLLVQIATRSPGTWQHSLAMANMAEIAANAVGANGRLVRVGAYYHDLGKSLQPKYFIENLEPGETSPHDQLPPEDSCDRIFAHVTEGLAAARRAGLHERIIDFMHMHHGNGVLEYFWARCQEQGNPKGKTIDDFRYPGVPPDSRETAILAIVDAVEAASRTLKKPEPAAIDSLVQRIVYGKLHLGQLDDSGLSMSDLRRIAEALRETIRAANHGRIEYPWQKEAAAAQAPATGTALTARAMPVAATPAPRLDSLDRPARAETADAEVSEAAAAVDGVPLAMTSKTSGAIHVQREPTGAVATPRVATGPVPVQRVATGPVPVQRVATGPVPVATTDALAQTANLRAEPAARPAVDNEAALAVDAAPPRPSHDELAISETAPALTRPTPAERRTGRHRTPTPADAPARAAAPAPKRRAQIIEDDGEGPLPPPVLDDDTSDDAEPAVTQPRLRMPLPPPPTSNPALRLPDAPWANGLAARIDAAIDHFEDFGGETPVIAPTAAELRALLGSPDPTKQQSIEELERLHRQARTAEPSEPEILHVRRFGETNEVDPDDIESAIEIAPPAKRTTFAVGVARKKKPAE